MRLPKRCKCWLGRNSYPEAGSSRISAGLPRPYTARSENSTAQIRMSEIPKIKAARFRCWLVIWNGCGGLPAGGGIERIGFGIETAAADDADGMPLGGEAAGQGREELDGGRGVGVEELV